METLLRELSESRIQVFAVSGSVLLFAFIVSLIRKGRLREEYALLWLSVCVFFALISVFRSALEWIAAAVGIVYAPAALLLLLVLGVVVILIHYSTVISKLSDQNKALVQEMAGLKHAIRRLENELDSRPDRQ